MRNSAKFYISSLVTIYSFYVEKFAAIYQRVINDVENEETKIMSWLIIAVITEFTASLPAAADEALMYCGRREERIIYKLNVRGGSK